MRIVSFKHLRRVWKFHLRFMLRFSFSTFLSEHETLSSKLIHQTPATGQHFHNNKGETVILARLKTHWPVIKSYRDENVFGGLLTTLFDWGSVFWRALIILHCQVNGFVGFSMELKFKASTKNWPRNHRVVQWFNAQKFNLLFESLP